MQFQQHGMQKVFIRSRRISLEPLHPLRAIGAGQVMDAEVKRRPAKRGRPFHRHGNAACNRNRTQQQGSLDIVVIRNRNQRVQATRGNLTMLQLVRHQRYQRRAPVRRVEVQRQAVALPGLASRSIKHPAHQRNRGAHGMHKRERLHRQAGVAVQRDAGGVTGGGIGFLPDVRYLRARLHGVVSWKNVQPLGTTPVSARLLNIP